MGRVYSRVGQGPQGNPGVNGVGLNFRTWSSGGTFAVLDAVYSNGSTYRCISPVGPTATPPESDPTHWTLVAAQGAQGPFGTAPDGSIDLAKLTPLARVVGGAPANALAHNFPRALVSATSGLTSSPARLRLCGTLKLARGVPITALNFETDTTGAGTPTHQWACLLAASDLTLLATSLDNTTGAWAASSRGTFTVATTLGGSTAGPYTPAADVEVIPCVLVAATTAPVLEAASGKTALLAEAPIRNSEHTANNFTDLPSFMTVINANAGKLPSTGAALGNTPYCWAT